MNRFSFDWTNELSGPSLQPVTPTFLGAVALIGLVGAALTSVAGFGGGMLLTLSLLAMVSPHEALALAAPALMLGHLHRLTLLHREVSWRHVGLLWLGALPVGALAAMLAVHVPNRLLAGAVVLTSLVGLVASRFVGRTREQDARKREQAERKGRMTVPAGGAVLGLLVSTTGIGGPVMPATLMSAGLSGAVFVATSTACAIGIHAVRIAGYSVAGMMDASLWPAVVAVAAASVVGNVVGRRLAGTIGDERARWVTKGVLVVSAMGAVVKLAG